MFRPRSIKISLIHNIWNKYIIETCTNKSSIFRWLSTFRQWHVRRSTSCNVRLKATNQHPHQLVPCWTLLRFERNRFFNIKALSPDSTCYTALCGCLFLVSTLKTRSKTVEFVLLLAHHTRDTLRFAYRCINRKTLTKVALFRWKWSGVQGISNQYKWHLNISLPHNCSFLNH